MLLQSGLEIEDLPKNVLNEQGDSLRKCTSTINRFFVYYRAKKNGIKFSPKDISFRDNELFETIQSVVDEINSVKNSGQ